MRSTFIYLVVAVDLGVTSSLTLSWTGGLVGAHHVTVIEWWFDNDGQSSARIRSDNAPIAIDAVQMVKYV
jgi:hypothetical protein